MEIVDEVPTSTTQYAVDQRNACIPVDPIEDGRAYTTRPIADPAARFRTLGTTMVGTGRTRTIVYTGDAGPILGFERFFDTELDAECRVVKIQDSYPCIPGHAPARQLFTDDRCETPVVVASAYIGTPPVFASFGDALHDIGAEVQVSRLYQDRNAECTPFRDGLIDVACLRYFEIGPEVDPTRFAEIREGDLDTSAQ